MGGGWRPVERVKARALKEESNHGKEALLLRDSQRGPGGPFKCRNYRRLVGAFPYPYLEQLNGGCDLS